ncbi:MAG: cyclin-dependent protein kinase [Cirrosporium novae-zelandiae]|nr:MAG: cyclin-dependent protein kinase [Cirrosporium novae-zelandiae]
MYPPNFVPHHNPHHYLHGRPNAYRYFPFPEPTDSRRVHTTGGYVPKFRLQDKYSIMGFISSGTYGRVYKVCGKNGQPGEFAIKKFKPDREGDMIQYTGLSQSAIREMALCTELSHPNVINLIEIILEDKCICMVLEYAEHDLLQIIHHHTQPPRSPIPAPTIKSILFQLLNGLLYLHSNWVLHRDLKPANIMVTRAGEVRIGDLGLARLFHKPLQSLFQGDKVVVTIWYRAPELLLGSRHYTPAIDLWAVGCIFAELLSLRPIFKGEEAKMDSKKTVPFQRNQMQKIIEILGIPTKERWPLLTSMPEYANLMNMAAARTHNHRHHNTPSKTFQYPGLENWYHNTLKASGYPNAPSEANPGQEGLDLLCALLEYDPTKRITAKDALEHPYFSTNNEKPYTNCFQGLKEGTYPARRITPEDRNIGTGSLPGSKRLGDELVGARSKRVKEG